MLLGEITRLEERLQKLYQKQMNLCRSISSESAWRQRRFGPGSPLILTRGEGSPNLAEGTFSLGRPANAAAVA